MIEIESLLTAVNTLFCDTIRGIGCEQGTLWAHWAQHELLQVFLLLVDRGSSHVNHYISFTSARGCLMLRAISSARGLTAKQRRSTFAPHAPVDRLDEPSFPASCPLSPVCVFPARATTRSRIVNYRTHCQLQGHSLPLHFCQGRQLLPLPIIDSRPPPRPKYPPRPGPSLQPPRSS